MERTRNSRSVASPKKNVKTVIASPQKMKTDARRGGGGKMVEEEDGRPESPFFGFSNSDIPQPIVIKTEPVESCGGDGDEEDCLIVNVTKASKPLPMKMIKKEIEDDDDIDTFHGFSLDDLPKPIVIKEEPVEDLVSAERADTTNIPDFFIRDAQPPLSSRSNLPEDGHGLLDEFQATVADTENNEGPQIRRALPPGVNIRRIAPSPTKPATPSPSKSSTLGSTITRTPPGPTMTGHQPPVSKFSPKVDGQKSLDRSNYVVIEEGGKPILMQQPKFVTKPSTKHDPKPQQPAQVKVMREEKTGSSLPKNVQIISENGEKIEFITQENEGEFDTDDTDEDHEFTVIVEDNDEEGVTTVTRNVRIDENNVIEGDSIEDIIAQFENDSSPSSETPKSVSCPNCRKCFVSNHFLNLHISNSSTMCDLCNTQCCSQVNLRNHKNLECDLSKRKRNIDLIAKETALLGRKPIEPEKYYNLPLDSEDEEDEGDLDDEFAPSPPPAKRQKSINDAKYECGVCGKYVKILDSHMRFVHGLEDSARGAKVRCPQCSVLVADLETHVARRHGKHAVVVEEDGEEVLRCRQPGCNLFFNNGDEVGEHMKREHSEDHKLPCGMGGCDEVFDNRGSLKRHRTEAHPELEEFKPVDLEPDDPDRAADMTVACPVCERKFKHKNTCTVHIKTNHLGWSKKKLFECPDCFKPFDNKKLVETHREAVHLGIRTVCPLCEKPVTRLDLHVRMVHADLPEWPCPDCGKNFKRKFDLNRHRVTVHLGVRNFPCDLCGKRFADMKDMTRHKNAVHYGMKIKWNSRKYKEKQGKLKPKKQPKEETESAYMRKKRIAAEQQQQELKLEESTVTYIETVETTGEEIIAMGGLEGSTVILENGTVLQSHLEAVKGAPGEPQVFIEADPDGQGAYRFVVMTEEEAGNVLEAADTVEVR